MVKSRMKSSLTQAFSLFSIVTITLFGIGCTGEGGGKVVPVEGMVLVGAYKVTVSASVPSDPKDEYSVPKSLINSKYSNPETSGLTAEVKEGAGSYEFKVTK